MATRRTYSEACGIPRALDRVGERWALMIVRELLLGPKRFTDIRTGLPHLGPDVLAQRLRELEENGVVQRRKLPPPAASQVYELTEWGLELEPVVMALGRWGARAPAPPDDLGMSFDSHVLSFRTLFDSELAGDFRTTLDLRFGDRPFRAVVADGQLEIGPGEAPDADATVRTDVGTLLALAHGRREPAEATRAGDIEVEGDKQAVKRFLALFPLPAPAA